MLNYPFTKKFSKEYLENYLLKLAKKTIQYIKENDINKLSNKLDGSELSQADLELDKIVYQSLKKLDITVPVISEERKVEKEEFLNRKYWLVDPIDGTRNYVNGGNQYTVNIALILNGNPVIGLIAHPPSDRVWLAIENSISLFNVKQNTKHKIFKFKSPVENPTILISREKNFRTDDFINNINNKKIAFISSSLKFCYLVMNKAILYPRFSKIKKWDIAAGHALLRASGGDLVGVNEEKYTYDYPSEFSEEFLAFNSKNWKKYFSFKKPINSNFII